MLSERSDRDRWEDARLLALKREEGATSQGMWVPLEAGKAEEMDSPLELSEGAHLASTLILAFWSPEL